eukprot:CAMPEP_0185761724 /NCGR_PEP_ID=MMETSP1174-20130828/20667_1 /TAXON_ID=35687 /ORGANISM="Dictyocha speculum, Strain CCMP1381" /LENGTH=42 /DNA_ID= /DNA_START= /DNA_END= /DNA_ORIENTATION=
MATVMDKTNVVGRKENSGEHFSDIFAIEHIRICVEEKYFGNG